MRCISKLAPGAQEPISLKAPSIASDAADAGLSALTQGSASAMQRAGSKALKTQESKEDGPATPRADPLIKVHGTVSYTHLTLPTSDLV